MQALDKTAARALKVILDGQPLSPAKIAFAWRMAAGPTLAAATTVRWSEGRLHVRARTESWRREVIRARPMVLARLREMVGADVVRSMEIDGAV